jgi:ornithine cyclodeaminase/alanine dehydrogenase-like protein (mu-crystallin family)
MKGIDVLFMSRSDVMALDLGPAQVMPVIKQALIEHSDGTYEMHPKIGVHPTGTDPANFIHAMPAYLHKLGACGLKWVGGFAKNYQHDLPNVTGVQVCNDPSTGIPLAIMDCSHLTGLRTAAVSATIARLCANRDAEVLALVGCGFQGGMHLQFMVSCIPSIKVVRLRDVREDSMVSLRERASAFFEGDVEVCPDNESCVRGADIICTCTNGDEQIVAMDWFKEGAFGVGIEGGCAYTAEALHQADKFIVDDVPLAQYFDEIGKDRVTEDGRPDPEFPGGMPEVYSTIGDIVAQKKKGRESANERIIATPIGMAICDIALAHLIYRSAIEKHVGQRLNLM